jgi:co-chaperonin GroES (HSP10)
MINKIRPHGKWILLKFEEIKTDSFIKTKGGLFKPSDNADIGSDYKSKPIYRGIVQELGQSVPVTEINYKVGDAVIWNEYDCKQFKLDDDNQYGLVKYDSVMAVYNSVETA